LIVISLLTSIIQLYRSRFLNIRKKFFPAKLSHMDEESKKIIANFIPDEEFLSAFQSENVIDSETKIRVQWNQNVPSLSVPPPISTNFDAIQLSMSSTPLSRPSKDGAGIQFKKHDIKS
jgi:hypothetical protein